MNDSLAGSAPEGPGRGLAQILLSHEIVSRDALFRHKDAEAVREQRVLFAMLGWINWLVLAVAVLSGLILAKGAFTDVVARFGWQVPAILSTPVLAGIVAVLTIAVTALGQIARDGDRLARWRKLRAEAEIARGDHFRALARAAAAQGPEAAKAAFDLVLRDLLASQRDWYEARAARHRASARITAGWNAAAVVLGATASAAAVTVVFNVSSEWVLIIGVLAAAFASFANDREGLFRDRANADLYDATAEKLAALAAGADGGAEEIARGNAGAVVVFADMVAEQLSAEHRQWATGLDVTGELLARLDQRLQQARAARPPTMGGATPAMLADPANQMLAGAAVGALGAVAGAGVADTAARVLAGATQGGIAGAAAQAIGVAAEAAGAAPALAAASDAAASLERWKPVLSAAAGALPPPFGDQARGLVEQVSAVAAPLAAGHGDAAATAAALIDRLRGDNPVGQWLNGAVPPLAGVLGTAMPPLALVMGIASVGAQLGDAAYRRWVTRVLATPFSPRQLEIEAIDSTAVLAALEVSPGFAAAFAAERARGDLAALSELGALLVGGTESLWARVAERFGGDRTRFEAALREIRAALLGAAGDADLAALPAGTVAGGQSPQALLAAADKLRGSAAGAEGLHATVQLVHEMRTGGLADPAAALLALATGGRDP